MSGVTGMDELRAQQGALAALEREAERLGFHVCRHEQWKQHVAQLDRSQSIRAELERRLKAQSETLERAEGNAERWGKAFDTSFELRETIEKMLGEKIDHLVEENHQNEAMIRDLQQAEQEHEKLIEKATLEVFRVLDHLGVKFDSGIDLRTALEALKTRVILDTVQPSAPIIDAPPEDVSL